MRQRGPSSADKPASSGSQWVRLRSSMWGFGRLPILWTLDASSAAGPHQHTKQPVNRFSTAESDFRCPIRRHVLTPRADDMTESYTSLSPVAAQCRVPKTQNSKGGLCLCNARSSSFVMACHSWAKGQYTRDQPSIRRHCRGGDRQPSSNVQTRMVTGLWPARSWPWLAGIRALACPRRRSMGRRQPVFL